MTTLPGRIPSLLRSLPAALLLTGLAVALCGCGHFTADSSGIKRKVPEFVPSNHGGDAKLPAALRRVVLLPLAGGTVASPESVSALDPVLVSALQLQNRFEVVPLTREECRRFFETDELPSVSPIPGNFMAVIRREYAADAVLFVDLTVYRAYHPLSLGFRAKLATVSNAHLVWTFDTIYSADDPAVVAAAEHYLSNRDQGSLPAGLSPVVLQSPVRFAAYATASMFSTLPPINAPAIPDRKDSPKGR